MTPRPDEGEAVMLGTELGLPFLPGAFQEIEKGRVMNTPLGGNTRPARGMTEMS